jgi:hypothetical protein
LFTIVTSADLVAALPIETLQCKDVSDSQLLISQLVSPIWAKILESPVARLCPRMRTTLWSEGIEFEVLTPIATGLSKEIASLKLDDETPVVIITRHVRRWPSAVLQITELSETQTVFSEAVPPRRMDPEYPFIDNPDPNTVICCLPGNFRLEYPWKHQELTSVSGGQHVYLQSWGR